MPQPNTGQKSKEKFFTPGLDKFGLIEAQAAVAALWRALV